MALNELFGNVKIYKFKKKKKNKRKKYTSFNIIFKRYLLLYISR